MAQRQVHHHSLNNWCYSVAFSFDGRLLAVGLDCGKIVLIDAGQRRRTLAGHNRSVSGVAFSPAAASLLASCSWDKTVRFWDVEQGVCVKVLEGHTYLIHGVAFSFDGSMLASACADKIVRLYRKTGSEWARQPLLVLYGHFEEVWSVSFSPDGRTLASVAWKSTVRLWSLPEGTLGLMLEGCSCVAFSPVLGSCLLAARSSLDYSVVRLWNYTSGQLLRQLCGHTDLVRSFSFSPDGSQLVSGSNDRTVQLWNVASGALLRTLAGHIDDVNSVVFAPNGKQVASASLYKSVRVWAVCEWSDRTHLYFGPELKRMVFQLMCVKERLEAAIDRIPRLPMGVWLLIFKGLLEY